MGRLTWHNMFPQSFWQSFALKSTGLVSSCLNLTPTRALILKVYFPVFFNNVAKFLFIELAVTFRSITWKGSFPACWRNVHITHIPKSSSNSNLPIEYRPISIISILSKLFQRLHAKGLSHFLNSNTIICYLISSLLLGRSLVPVMHFCLFCIMFKLPWMQDTRRNLFLWIFPLHLM